jgi:BCD family chlorophyll transporter-like MFS transporter
MQIAELSRGRVIRLGLFQLVAGGLSVLFLGVLNRVLRVELGLDLFIVSLLIGGGHYLGALVAIPFGFYSDRHPIAGYRRTPYILLNITITVLVLAAAPFVGRWVAQFPTIDRVVIGFLFFSIEGISTYIAGTAFLALVTDLTGRKERGRVTGIIWTMLMLGIILVGVASGLVFTEYTFESLVVLFAGAGLIAWAVSWFAILGQERKVGSEYQHSEISLRSSVASIFQNTQARRFAAFLMLSMFSLFMYDVILEPFGGEVFELSPAETTRFNAYLGVGLITAMLLGGAKLIPARGKRWTTGLGVLVVVAAFSGLAWTALSFRPSSLPLWILLLGVGAGWFTVGGIALMMDMTPASQTGLFIGAWTLVQALARGPASFAGGALQSLFLSIGSSPAQAYAYVFVVEAAGLAISLLLLRRVDVEEFQSEAIEISYATAEALQ